MTKTQSPAIVSLEHGEFQANALPDPFDERDLEYHSRLQLLPDSMDMRDPKFKNYYVYNQQGSSCTGHAVASMVNIQLLLKIRQVNNVGPDQAIKTRRVSPYMLYCLGRRYDEFQGEEDIGSSLRGALKGWFHHGVINEGDWESPPEPEAFQKDDPDFWARCRALPLGAYYRINPLRLDDLQSAVTELGAIAASAAIHDGWVAPLPVTRGQETMYVICRSENPQPLGGHAFAIVGYNDIGFLVQNSWGQEWGHGGFATLPYEDWLETAYDAWVARLGVPQTPSPGSQHRTSFSAGSGVVTVSGPDLEHLRFHVINLGNNGRLSRFGKANSNPHQIESVIEMMDQYHTAWADVGQEQRQVIFYAHGGLVNDKSGLEVANRHVNWWLNNRIYPIYFAWQSGAAETFINQLVDAIRERLPFGAGEGLWEQLDRRVERVAQLSFTWMWDEMKENARLACEPLIDKADWEEQPGASLLVDRLKKYIENQGASKVAVHLVGHSAGSIFHANLLERLLTEGIQVDSISYLAPGIRVDDFSKQVMPHIGKKHCRLAVFNLSDKLELDDNLQTDALRRLNIAVYQKSLLYLVSRALERGDQSNHQSSFEVPLLGMQRFCKQNSPDETGITLEEDIKKRGGKIVYSSYEPVTIDKDRLASQATGHDEFDDDPTTMTSVLIHILRQPVSELLAFTPKQPLQQANFYPIPSMARPIWLHAQPSSRSIPEGGVIPASRQVKPEAEVEEAAFEIIPMSPAGGIIMTAARPSMETKLPEPIQAPEIDKNQYPILSRLAAAGWEYPEKRSTE